ncbi:hypothetical protein BURPS1710b_A0096 [Burkholderia pseudomallei 1710b]|uniref:Uncharacterized protein n=1 Tax=Burkholderia pseudomallei (strain 1710b) TaxID=320372 RepID=Q3JME8_BURP1|nr:hypothetical protein BURPS1710b_A0096 [Burkholderia pseudomallei 1710b]
MTPAGAAAAMHAAAEQAAGPRPGIDDARRSLSA